MYRHLRYVQGIIGVLVPAAMRGEYFWHLPQLGEVHIAHLCSVVVLGRW